MTALREMKKADLVMMVKDLRARPETVRAELDEARIVIKERNYSLTLAHLHLGNYSDHIENLETEIRKLKGLEGPSPLPIPGHRKELAVTKEQCPVWNRHVDKKALKAALQG